MKLGIIALAIASAMQSNQEMNSKGNINYFHNNIINYQNDFEKSNFDNNNFHDKILDYLNKILILLTALKSFINFLIKQI